MSNIIRSLNKIYRKCKNIYRFKKYKKNENTIQVSDSIIRQLKLNIDGKRNHIIIKHVKLNPKARLCIKSIPHFLWCGRPSHAFCGDFCSNIFCGVL